jgi:hypothetical protein
MQRGGAGVSHTLVYGPEHDQRALLSEHRANLHAQQPSTMKRIGDQSHLILDTPPATVKKNGAAVTPPPQSSARRKASNLEVTQPISSRIKSRELGMQTQLYPSDGGMTGPLPAPQDRLVSIDGDVIPARRHGNAVASPSDSPSKGDLFSKLTQESSSRFGIRTFERPQTSLFGSEVPEPARLCKKPVVPSNEKSKIELELEAQLAALKAREKLAKRAKGAVVALPLNVSSPEERHTRRHHNHRYMYASLTYVKTPQSEYSLSACRLSMILQDTGASCRSRGVRHRSHRRSVSAIAACFVHRRPLSQTRCWSSCGCRSFSRLLGNDAGPGEVICCRLLHVGRFVLMHSQRCIGRRKLGHSSENQKGSRLSCCARHGM